MLMRSDWGLTNRTKFTRTQYTLYVEGGGGVVGQGSFDVIFWRSVFRKLRPDLLLSVQAAGGKPELETIAHKVSTSLVHNTLVAMDVDFDEILGDKISSRFVLYTYGYSWENDAYCTSCIAECVSKLCLVDRVDKNILTKIGESYNGIMRDLLEFVNADYYLRTQKSSLFPKLKVGHFISHVPETFEPLLLVEPLRHLCNLELGKYPIINQAGEPNFYILDSGSYTQGHVLHALFKKFISYAARLYGRSLTVTDDLAVQTAIPTFCDHTLGIGGHIDAHYRSMLSAI